MKNEYKTIVGITKSKSGKISISNKIEFVEDFDTSFHVNELDSSLLLDFKTAVFNKLQPDEWFYIDLTEDDIKAIKEKIKLPRTNLSKEESLTLQYVIYFYIEDNLCTRYNLERFTNKSIGTPHILLTPKRGNAYKYKKANEDDIQITGDIRIKFYEDKKQLYFKKHSDLRGLLDISSIFEEATQKEINDFKEYSIINFTKEFRVGDRNKQKIKMILEKKDAYLSDSSKKAALKTYAKDFKLAVFNDNDILDVPNNKALADIVDLLLENFNSDPISKQKVRIQSKTPYKTSSNEEA